MTKLAPAPKPAPSKAAKVVGGLVTAAIVITVGVWIAVTLANAKAPDDSAQAKISTCESLVSDALKSPATAKYSGEKLTGAVVSGSVDSQNGFGATVRSDFVCEVDGATVKLDAVTQR